MYNFKFRHLFLILSVTIGGYCNNLLYAQEQIQPYKPAERVKVLYKSKSDCLDKFNMDTVLSEGIYSDAYLLADYFWCRAILDEKILNKNPDLEKLKQGFTKGGGEYAQFKRYKCWTGLITENRVTPRLIKDCEAEFPGSPEKRKETMNAFLSRDASICGDDRNCRAFMTLDENLANNESDRAFIYYLKALNDFDSKKCQKITQNNLLKMTCEAYITANERACERYKDFDKFREAYCSQVEK